MPTLVALDVAVLPPAAVSARAITFSGALPRDQSQGLTLDGTHHPHITLTQQFVRSDELDSAFDRIGEVVGVTRPLRLRVTGSGHSGNTVLMEIERTAALVELHERLLEALRGLERPEGTRDAFFDSEARVGDVLWVASYRLKSSFGAFTPHITLGHAERPPHIDPFEFDATTVAACHLGRFCTCRTVLRSWSLSSAG